MTIKLGDAPAFGRDFLSVRHADGTHVHFTRQERAILMRLVEKPGRLLPRDLLVAAITDGNEPVGDRHVDFLINQLRRKLRDDARAPRFIRTQYGEGYVWIGTLGAPEPEMTKIVRRGPVYGEHLPGAVELVDGLVFALERRLDHGAFRSGSTFILEASMHDRSGSLQAAVVLRQTQGGAIIDTFRVPAAAGRDEAALAETLDAMARAIWSHTALPRPLDRTSPSAPPPWVDLFESALLMDGDLLTWKSNAARLQAMLAEDPSNAAVEVMRGLNLYTWLIQSFYDPSGATIGEAQWREVEDEIETIALSHLPRFEDQPIMQLAAAKLLLFVHRGYLHLSRRIADDLLSSSSAHAAAFALAGEAAGFAGDTEQASELLARAVELSEPGSPFHVYLLVVEAIAVFAANDTACFQRVCHRMREVAPDAYATVQAFCVLPGAETTPFFVHGIARDSDRASEALRFLWNVSGRRFALRGHRRNFMRPLASALVQPFGVTVIPAEVDIGTGLRAELG